MQQENPVETRKDLVQEHKKQFSDQGIRKERHLCGEMAAP